MPTSSFNKGVTEMNDLNKTDLTALGVSHLVVKNHPGLRLKIADKQTLELPTGEILPIRAAAYVCVRLTLESNYIEWSDLFVIPGINCTVGEYVENHPEVLTCSQKNVWRSSERGWMEYIRNGDTFKDDKTGNIGTWEDVERKIVRVGDWTGTADKYVEEFYIDEPNSHFERHFKDVKSGEYLHDIYKMNLGCIVWGMRKYMKDNGIF